MPLSKERRKRSLDRGRPLLVGRVYNASRSLRYGRARPNVRFFSLFLLFFTVKPHLNQCGGISSRNLIDLLLWWLNIGNYSTKTSATPSLSPGLYPPFSSWRFIPPSFQLHTVSSNKRFIIPGVKRSLDSSVFSIAGSLLSSFPFPNIHGIRICPPAI